jgi:glucose-6-phosphate 1-dehydrogenase
MGAPMPPTILIIIGITGDLSRRKLLPAIEEIVRAGAAPEHFKVVGVTRQPMSAQDVLHLAAGDTHTFLETNLAMCQMDVTKPNDYDVLRAHLAEIEETFGMPAQRLFYVSVPPQVAQPIVGLLGASGLSKVPHTKLLLEKPFGTDLTSAQELIEQTKRYFSEDQVYRIDHYLAKEMAQNLIVFRGSNTLFRRTWNNDFIESVEILATEDISIEGRASFYEQTGALRDLVQSHLLQLAALTLMSSPHVGKLDEVPAGRLAALKQLRVAPGVPIPERVHRAQYEGYRTEVNNPHSTVETYVDITLESTDPAWQGVPIRLITGKALAQKTTQICLTYKKDAGNEPNMLVITLQPDEGVQLCLWAKVPGYEWRVDQHAMSMAFKDYFADMPEAYEQVLVDAMQSNHTLFTSSDEVIETWRILQPVQAAWALSDAADLHTYRPGTTPYMAR